MVNFTGIRDRADRIQQGRRWLAFPYAVIKKYGEDSSGNLAVLLTYYTFFSVFPLLVALFSVLGFVLHGHPEWQTQIQDDALSKIPIKLGPIPLEGSTPVIVGGLLLTVYAGLGVGKTAQTVGDIVYRVPKADRPNFLLRNLRALRLVLVGGLGLLATTVLASTIAAGSLFGLHLSVGLGIASVLVTLVLNTLLFALIFRWSTVKPMTFRHALPGALISATALLILQTFVSSYVAHKLQGAKPTYGALASVIVLLSWFYLQSQVLVLSAQVNVVNQDRLWPRSMTEPPLDTTEIAGVPTSTLPKRGGDVSDQASDGARS
jgi:membrane protein